MWLLPDAWGIEALFLSCKTAKISTKKLGWVLLSNTPLAEKMARSYKRWRHSQSVAIQNWQNTIWGHFQIPNLCVRLFLFSSTVLSSSGQIDQFSYLLFFRSVLYFQERRLPQRIKERVCLLGRWEWQEHQQERRDTSWRHIRPRHFGLLLLQNRWWQIYTHLPPRHKSFLS